MLTVSRPSSPQSKSRRLKRSEAAAAVGPVAINSSIGVSLPNEGANESDTQAQSNDLVRDLLKAPLYSYVAGQTRQMSRLVSLA